MSAPDLRPALRASVSIAQIKHRLRFLAQEIRDEHREREETDAHEDEALACWARDVDETLDLFERWEREELRELLRWAEGRS